MPPIKIPPIKSQGIKSKLVPWLSSIVKSGLSGIGRWVEPFVGTCVVPLNISAESYLLADANPHLIEFYLCVQRWLITPLSARKFLKKSGEELAKGGAEFFYNVRERFNARHEPLDFLFLNRACFNGLIRFNRKGEFNAPFCKKNERFREAYITKICNQIKNLAEFLKFAKVDLFCQDFRKTLGMANGGDIIYCDPPYMDRYRDYYNGWSERDEMELCNLLKNSKAKFILSTWHHNRFRKNIWMDRLWSQFNVLRREHFYHLGAREDNRHGMVEALATNIPFMGACAAHSENASPPRVDGQYCLVGN